MAGRFNKGEMKIYKKLGAEGEAEIMARNEKIDAKMGLTGRSSERPRRKGAIEDMIKRVHDDSFTR